MKDYKHSEEVEQRMFHLDVEALKQYSREFADAFDSGRNFSMTIELAELFKLVHTTIAFIIEECVFLAQKVSKFG